MGAEVFHALKKVLQGRRPQHQRRRRGRLRAEPQVADEALDFIMRGDREAPATSPGEDVALALDSRLDRVLQGRQVRARRRGQDARRRRAWSSYLAELVDALPDRLDRGRHGRGRLGRLEAADRRARRTHASSSATTSSSPTPSASTRGHREAASPTRSWSRSTRSAR